jgi:hypothetical protein
MQNTLINCFISIDRKSISQNLPLSNILDQIKNGNIITDGIIEQARLHGKGSEEYEHIKKTQLLNFAFNFKFQKTVEEENIITSTGLLFLDVDQIKTDGELNLIKENIAKLPFVVACWKSLSGKGLGFLARVDDMTSENYSAYKNYFKNYFNGNSILLGHILDKNAFKTIQRTVLSKDENIYINYDAVPVKYDDVLFFTNQSSKLNNRTSCIHEGEKNIGEYLLPCPDKNYSSLIFSNEDFYMSSTDEAYIVHKEKVPVIKIYLPKGGEIKKGNRNNMFFLLSSKLIANNGIEKRKDILYYLFYLREKHCENAETFPKKEVENILNRAIKNFDPTKTNPRMKRITFNSAAGMTIKEKQSIGAKAAAEFKRNNTIELLSKHYKPGVTQRKLGELSGVSERTVRRYWNVNEDGTISFRMKEKSAPDNIEQPMQALPDDSMSLSATTYSMVIESMEETATSQDSIDKHYNLYMGRISSDTGTDYFGGSSKKKQEPKQLTKDEMEWWEGETWDDVYQNCSKEQVTAKQVKVEAPPFTADMFE